MAVPELHFFAANDVNGATILEVPVTEDYVERIVARPALRELGYMAFRFSRQVGFAIFDSGAFQPETFVRLLVPDVSTTRYLWGCFLNDRVQQLVARVKAGENFDFGGPGPKHYLSRAILWDEPFSGTGYNIDLANGVFRWKETATAGRVLNRLIAEDGANTIAEFLPDLTKSFTDGADSASVAWANDIAGSDEFELRIGDDYLTNLFKIEDSGDLETTMFLGTVATPVLRLDAWQAYGRDLTGPIGAATVHFKEAVNILGDLSVAGASQRKASHALVEGLDAAYGRAVRSSWDPGEYAKAVAISHDTTKNENVLGRYGLDWLRRQANNENEILVPHYPGFNQAAGLYFPSMQEGSGHYWIGDTVSLTTGGDAGGTWTPLDYRSEDQRIMAITMEMRSVVKDGTATEGALSWNVIAELNVERGSDALPAAQGSGRGGGCKCLQVCTTGALTEIATSTSWKSTPTDSPPAGWHDAGFDDSAFDDAVNTSDTDWYNPGSLAWIWSTTATEDDASLRTEFTLTAIPDVASVLCAADGDAEIFINGTSIGTQTAWATAGTFDVDTSLLVVGANCISLIGHDLDALGQVDGAYAVLTLGAAAISRAAPCEHGHLHNELSGRGEPDAHPINSITGLQAALDAAGSSSLPWYVVTDYATPDDAIAAYNAGGGGVLYFPVGTYTVAAGLTAITQPGIIMGDGNTASKVVCSSATANLFTISTHKVTIKDLWLDNSHATPTAGAAIRVTAGNLNHYERLTISDFWIGIDHEDGIAWVMNGLYIESVRKYGIQIVHATPDFGDWAIDNSVISDAAARSADAAIRIESSGGGKITNLKVNGTAATGYNHGIDLSMATGVQTIILLVTNCSIENIRGDGIHAVTAGTGRWPLMVIAGNQFALNSNNAGKAISLVAASASPTQLGDTVIANNLFATDGTARSAVQLTNVDNTTFVGNVLIDNFTSESTETTCTNITHIGGGVTDHGALTGLTDDDHTQYLKETDVAAKGDTYAASANDTVGVLTVGSDNQVLTADSTQALGVRWGTPSGGSADTVAAHGARVKRSADLSVGNNTLTLMAWTAEDFDTDTIHDNSTNNSRLIIPSITGVTTGIWQVRCFGYTNQTSAGRSDCNIRLNAAGSAAGGTAIGFGSNGTPATQAIQGFLAACQYVFTAGDYVEAFVRTTAGTFSVIFDAGASPIFEIVFLGKVT